MGRVSKATAQASAESRLRVQLALIRAIRAQQLVCIRACLELGAAVASVDRSGSQPLHYAVILPGSADVVSLLLQHGAPVNTRLPGGQTPLMLAAIRANQGAVERLIAAGADPNVPDAQGHTPLMVVCRSGHEKLAKLLLEAGAKPDLKDNDRRTALWYAVKYEQRSAAIVLRQDRVATRRG